MNQLSDKLKSSLLFSFLDKYFGYILRFISTIIIARLLTPEEIGIFSVAFVVISIGHVLRDFGVAQYLIQEKTLSDEKIRAAFGTMFIIAWSMWLLLFLCKNQFAQFYDEPRLAQALNVLTIIFLLAPFGSVRIALLRREMHFKTLAKINVFSYVCLFIVTIGLCYLKFSFMALVWGQLAGVIATNIGCVIACKGKYWYLPSLKGSRQVIKFGTQLTVANIAENVAEGAPDLFIGRFLNMQAVGLFSRAQGCVSLFKVFVSASVWPVILPYFSLKNRSGEKLLPDYLKAISIYSAFAWPFFIALLILAEPVVLTLYGDQWVASILLVKILCIAAILEACFPFRNALMISLGKTKQHLQVQLVVSGLRIVSILVGSIYGLRYAAIGLSVSEFVSQFYIFLSLKNIINISFRQWILSTWVSFSAMVFVALGCFVAQQVTLIYQLSNWITILLAMLICAVIWIITLFMTAHPLKDQLTNILSKLSSKKLREKTL